MRLSRQGPSLFVQTPAKLNIFLDVVGRRQDGFHDLETLMVSVGLYDSLRFSPAADGQLTLKSHSLSLQIPPPPEGPRNLVLKAARLLQQESGTDRGAEITLWKRIPSEAGMGGGSSDAAATLVALNEFWNLQMPASQLHDLAAQLGSDVNFFLDSHPAAVCTGRGEMATPLRLGKPGCFVVVKPADGLSTPAVFSVLGLKPGEGGPSPSRDPLPERLCRLRGEMIRNDLQTAARSLSPAVERCLDELQRLHPAGTGLTGSGSACFALCRSVREARHVAGRCRQRRLGQVWVLMTGT